VTFSVIIFIKYDSCTSIFNFPMISAVIMKPIISKMTADIIFGYVKKIISIYNHNLSNFLKTDMVSDPRAGV
jgi:hypothetical protein